MKKIILILALVLIAFSASAQDWFGLEYSINVGYASSQFGGFDRDPVLYGALIKYPEAPFNSFYTTLGFEAWLFGTFFVGTSITTQIEPWEFGGWNPTFTDYMFEAGFQLWIFRFGWQHDCTHPINTYQYTYKVSSLWGEGAIDKIYLQVHSSFGNVPK